jgi:hypothetical protein
MRQAFVLAALLAPLGGCYVPPQPAPTYGYAAPGYPAPGYQPPGYAPDPYAVQAEPGFDYNNGVPVIIEGGATVPLVLLGGEWGYYDRERHWRRAPDQVYRRMEQYQHQGWAGHPGAPPPHFEGHPPPRYEGRPYEGHPPYGGGRYGGPPPEAMRPAAAPYQRPAPPPQAAPQQREQHEQHYNRGCQPNQRC